MSGGEQCLFCMVNPCFNDIRLEGVHTVLAFAYLLRYNQIKFCGLFDLLR